MDQSLFQRLQSAGLERLLAGLPAPLRADAGARYARHAPALIECLHRLYGADDRFETWFVDLVGTMAGCIAVRSPILRALDASRVQSPDWFTRPDRLGYCAYVDRLATNLAGVGKRIPYLCELGVNYLHLLPFLKARAGDNDGGFAVASYEEVEPRLGTMADLERLAALLREAGISLCADFVLNHVADDHPWAVGAAAGDERLRRYFHVFPDRTQPALYERTLVQVFPGAAPGNFTRVECLGWVWTTFYPYQWDLNDGNPEVFAAMAATLLGLANRGIEVFRCDATAYLWKRAGTSCMNQPETHWILQAFRRLLEIAAPGVLLKAEAIVPTRELPPYFGEGPARGHECHLAYHSSLMAAAWAGIAEQDPALLRRVIVSTPELPEACSWITYVRCHDDIGWNVLSPDVELLGDSPRDRLGKVSSFFSGAGSSFARGAAFQTQDSGAHSTNGMASALAGFASATTAGESADARRRWFLLHGLAMCFGGLPVIYMGDELALGNDDSPEARRLAALDGRWLHRPPLDDARFAERLDPETEPGQVFAEFLSLVRQRQQLSDLAADQPRALLDCGHASVLGLRRGDGFMAFANFSAQPVTVPLPAVSDGGAGRIWFDCFSNTAVEGPLTLEPWELRWLRGDRCASHD